MIDLAKTSGLLSVVQGLDYDRLAAHGYKWLSFQAWNSGARGPTDVPGDYNFSPARKAGFSVGVWVVIYQEEHGNRREIARQAGARAVALGADHLIFDIEYEDHDATNVIEGARAGGWTGPIHLTPLGAPEFQDAEAGVFWERDQDIQSFVKTGGVILPQAYYAPVGANGRHPNYAAKTTLAYYAGQLGVPRDQLNLMIWPNGTNSDTLEAELLAEAGLGPAMSVFLAETTSEAGYLALERLTKAPVSAEVLAAMRATAAHQVEWWTWQGKDPVKQRIGAADALLGMDLTTFYAKWPEARTILGL